MSLQRQARQDHIPMPTQSGQQTADPTTFGDEMDDRHRVFYFISYRAFLTGQRYGRRFNQVWGRIFLKRLLI